METRIGFDIDHAARLLSAGDLVAFPTETVYGLGADAANPEAVNAVFTAKNRPTSHPLIVHLAGVDRIGHWAKTIAPGAEKLIEAFWPGPLTLILKRAASVCDQVTGGQDTVGLRVPNHALALALLRTFDAGTPGRSGIAAPSANRFGRISPTTAGHVRDELDGRIAYILDGGSCPIGIESTIVDYSSGRPRVLRPGMITAHAIAAVCGRDPEEGGSGDDAPRASGTLAGHYAPRTPLFIVPSAQLDATIAAARGCGQRVALIGCRVGQLPASDQTIELPDKADLYANKIYAVLRHFDDIDIDIIIAEAPPQTPEWVAVNDRLQRSSCGSRFSGC